MRSGSGDQRATDMEILAMERDQAFGSKWGENQASGVKKWGDSPIKWGEKVFARRKKLVGLLIDNPQIAIPEMAARMSLGTTAIENHLRILRQQGFIEHIGPAKGGQWVVYVCE